MLILPNFKNSEFQPWFRFPFLYGIRVVGKGSWKKTRSWKDLSSKFQNEIGKNEVGKFGLKLESSG